MKFKRVAIIFFSFLIIICLLLFYLGLMIQFFLYPGIYLESMEKAKVFQTIDENIAKTPNAQFIEMDQGSRPFVQNILSNILSYLRLDMDTLNLTVAIDKEELHEFFVNQTNKAPVCEPGKSPDFKNLDNLCRPADKSVETFTDEFLEEKNLTFLEKDEVDLASIYGLEENSKGKVMLDKARNIISIYQIILYASLGLIAFFIFCIFLIRDSNKKLLRIIGIDVLISIILSFILGLILFNLANNLLSGKNEYILIAVDAILSSFVEQAFLIGAIFFIISIVLIVSSFFMKQKNFVS